MACCCVSNCGDNVTINTCCDGSSTTDGSQSSTLGSFSATPECVNGDLKITVTGFNPCGSYSATYDGITFNDTDCVITIPNYSIASPIVISTETARGTDTITIEPEPCTSNNYALSVQCSTIENELNVGWLNPNNETLYLYRQDNSGTYTLIYTGTDTSYTDTVVWGNVYTYVLSKQDTPTYIIASSLFDSSVCSPCSCNSQATYDTTSIEVDIGGINTTTFTLVTKTDNIPSPCNATLQGLDIFRLDNGQIVPKTDYTVTINNWFFTEVAGGLGKVSVVFTVYHSKMSTGTGYRLSDSIVVCFD